MSLRGAMWIVVVRCDWHNCRSSAAREQVPALQEEVDMLTFQSLVSTMFKRKTHLHEGLSTSGYGACDCHR